ncbi:MAG: hypothetical protein ABIC82_04100 [bacterium]
MLKQKNTMNKKFKVGLVGLLSLALMLGMSGIASAAITLGATTVASNGVLTLTGATSIAATSSGALTLTGATASTWSTVAGDLTVEAGTTTPASLVLISDEATTDAINIDATAGGMDVDTVLATAITVTGTDDAHDLSLITSGVDFGDIVLTSGDDVAVTAADDITVTTTDGSYTLTAGGASNGNMTFAVGNAFVLSGADASTYVIGDTATTGTITLGNSLVSNTISVGSGIMADSATQTINIGNAAANGTTAGGYTVNIAATNPSAANGVNAVNIGNAATGAANIAIRGGSSGTITVGSVAGTGNITLGASTAAQTVNIGSGAAGTTAQVVNIGTGVASTGSKTVNIATDATSGVGTTTVSIANGANAGVTTVNIANTAIGAVAKVVGIAGGNDGAASTVNIGNGNKTGLNTLAFGTGTGAQTITIGNGSTGAETITIGNAAATSGTTTLAGYNLTLTPNAAGAVTIGSATLAGNTIIRGTLETGTNSLFDNTTTANTTIGAALTSGTLTIGKSDQTGAVVINGSTNGANTLFNNVAGGSITIGTVATGAISIGAGSAIHAITIGSTDTTSTLALIAGSDNAGGGITVTGAINGASPLSFEGATANGFETTLAVTDPTADNTITIPAVTNGALMLSTLTTNATDIANSVWGGTNQLIMEGATADDFETIITPTDATADRTVTIPDRTGQVQLASACSALTADTAVTLTVGLSNCYTDTIDTDDEDQTITFSAGGTSGDMITIIFITDAAGAGDEVITFHTTLVNSTGTLTLASGASERYTVTFISDGTVWNEISRTAVQT